MSNLLDGVFSRWEELIPAGYEFYVGLISGSLLTIGVIVPLAHWRWKSYKDMPILIPQLDLNVRQMERNLTFRLMDNIQDLVRDNSEMKQLNQALSRQNLMHKTAVRQLERQFEALQRISQPLGQQHRHLMATLRAQIKFHEIINKQVQQLKEQFSQEGLQVTLLENTLERIRGTNLVALRVFQEILPTETPLVSAEPV